MPQTSTNSSASRMDRFSATRWSLVAGLDRGELERQSSMAQLCKSYFFPVYAHIRGREDDKHEAYDLTRAFLLSVLSGLEKNTPDGRFRTFLLERLNRFLADPRSASDDSLPIQLPDLEQVEQRYQNTRRTMSASNDTFNANYATEVLGRSLSRLEQEAADNDRLPMYQLLVRFLVKEPSDIQFKQLTEDLRLSKLSVVVALKRLRARFNELVNRELSDTVGSPEDLERERGVLFEVLRAKAKP